MKMIKNSKEEEVKNEMLKLFHLFSNSNKKNVSLITYINEIKKVVDISDQDISIYRKKMYDHSFEEIFRKFEKEKKDQVFGHYVGGYIYLPHKFKEQPLSCVKTQFESIYPVLISKLWANKKIKFKNEIVGYLYSILIENQEFYKKNLSNKKGKYSYFKNAINSLYGITFRKDQNKDFFFRAKYIWNDIDYIPILVTRFNNFMLENIINDLVDYVVYADTDIIYFLKEKKNEAVINKYIKQNTFNDIKYYIDDNIHNYFLNKKRYLELEGNQIKVVGNFKYINLFEMKNKLMMKQRKDKLNLVFSE